MSKYAKSLKEFFNWTEPVILSYSGPTPAFVEYVAENRYGMTLRERSQRGTIAKLAKKALKHERFSFDSVKTYPEFRRLYGDQIFQNISLENFEEIKEEISLAGAAYSQFNDLNPDEPAFYGFNLWLEKNIKIGRYDLWIGGEGLFGNFISRSKVAKRLITARTDSCEDDEFMNGILGKRSIELISK